MDAESERLYREHDAQIDAESEKLRKSQSKRQWRAYKIILYALAVMTLFGYMGPVMDFSTTLRENTAFFWTSMIILLGAAAVLVVDVYRLFAKNKTADAPAEEAEETKEDETEEDEDPVMQELTRLAKEELQIPEDAVEIDVLFCTYQEKRGEWKPSLLMGYFPLSVWCYADEENLYLATDCVVYALPHTAFVRQQTVAEKITVAFWNKSVPCDEPPYDAYGMRENSMGSIRMKDYCSMQWRVEGEDYELMIPSYDAATLLSLVKQNY